MPKISAERIVIRSPNWLGDAMMSTPAVMAIRNLYPSAYISVITKSALSDLWAGNPNITEVIELPETRSLLRIMKISQKLKREKFDIAVLFTNSISSTLELSLSKIPYRIGYQNGLRRFWLTHSIPDSKSNQHFVKRYMRLTEILGSINDDIEMYFPINEDLLKKADDLFDKNSINSKDIIIGFNPGAAYGTAKRWLPERFIELANQLSKDGDFKIVFFGGGKDFVDIQKIVNQIQPKPVNLAGQTGLLELGACISRCKLFITNDSGPMHIAGALSVPLISIFGSTNPDTTGPWGSGRMEVIRKKVECAPCLLRECPIDHRCMIEISVQDVYDTCLRLLTPAN